MAATFAAAKWVFWFGGNVASGSLGGKGGRAGRGVDSEGGREGGGRISTPLFNPRNDTFFSILNIILHLFDPPI